MPSFTYRAHAAAGLESGRIDAIDRAAALRELRGRGLRPVVLEEGRRGRASRAQATDVARGGLKLKPKELQWFTEELADMLKAGLQLEPALRALAERSAKGNLGPVAGKIRDELRDGSSFSVALAQASPSFSPLYRSLCAAGEASGSISHVLEGQAEHLEAMAELKNRVIMALIYPAFLMVAGLGVVILFVTYLVPMLTELLSGGGSIPPGAAALIAAAKFIRVGVPWILVIVAALVGLAWWWRRDPDNRRRWDKALLHLPLSGPLGRSHFAAQFAKTLSTIVGGGLPLLRGLQLTRETTGNHWYRHRIDLAAERVAEGADLSRSLQDTEEIPPLLLDIIRLGEHTGSLPKALARAGERFEKELGSAIARLTAMIGPALVFSIAIPIGAIAYLVITAIFDTMSGIQ